jgi:hypothetical protein
MVVLAMHDDLFALTKTKREPATAGYTYSVAEITLTIHF